MSLSTQTERATLCARIAELEAVEAKLEQARAMIALLRTPAGRRTVADLERRIVRARERQLAQARRRNDQIVVALTRDDLTDNARVATAILVGGVE